MCYFKKRKHLKDCRLVLAPHVMQPHHANTPHSLSVDFGVSVFYALLLLYDLRINTLSLSFLIHMMQLIISSHGTVATFK